MNDEELENFKKNFEKRTEEMKNWSRSDIIRYFAKIGIYDENGNLTKEYGGKTINE